MKIKRLGQIIFLLIFSMILFGGCTNKEIEEMVIPKYSFDIAYIGDGIAQSDNVTGINIYSSIGEYIASGNVAKCVWANEDILWNWYEEEGTTVNDFIDELLNKGKNVIVLRKSSDILSLYQILKNYGHECNNLLDIQKDQIIEQNNSLVGVLLTSIVDDYIVPVHLYSNGANITDFLAFTSIYDFKSNYQGNNMLTEVYPTQKIAEVFNVYDLNGKAYSVTMATVVDFINNPSKINNEYKFQHTVLGFTDVIPIKNKVQDVSVSIWAGEKSYTISMSPEDNIDFDKNLDLKYNFLFNRYFNICKNPEYKGKISVIEKGYGVESPKWILSVLDKKENSIGSYKKRNITVAADLINTLGHYMPEYNTSIKVENDDGSVAEYNTCTKFDVWAVVWGDDYEDYQ